jgi:simple sugar transport system permease protein
MSLNVLFFLVQQMMFFSIPLLIVALGGMFSERGGVVNIALEGIMIMGAFTGILFLYLVQNVEGGGSPNTMPGQLLLLIALLISAVSGAIIALPHAFASVHMRANQVISGTAINMFTPAFAVYVARMIRSVQQIPFKNQFYIESVPVLGNIPFIGPFLFQKTYITTY